MILLFLFLKRQPCHFPVMVFCLFTAIYLGFCQCSFTIMLVVFIPYILTGSVLYILTSYWVLVIHTYLITIEWTMTNKKWDVKKKWNKQKKLGDVNDNVLLFVTFVILCFVFLCFVFCVPPFDWRQFSRAIKHTHHVSPSISRAAKIIIKNV